MISVEVLLLLAVVLGAFAQGATGIGFGLLCAPVAALVLDPADVVGTVARVALVVDVALVLGGRASVDGRVLRNYALPAIAAVPLAVATLAVVPDTAVVVAVSVLTLAGATALLGARAVPDAVVLAAPAGPQLAAGFLAGFMGVTSGMPGPPVALEAARRHAPPAQARATLAVLFLCIDGIAAVANPTSVSGTALALLAAASLVGLLAAARWARAVDVVLLRRALVVLIVVSSLAAIARALA